MKFKRLFSTGLVMVLSLGFVTGVAADYEVQTEEQIVRLQITGGEIDLKVPSIEDFGEVIIQKDTQYYTTGFKEDEDTEGNLVIQDTRGTEEGWSVKVEATRFKNEEGEELPEGTLHLEWNKMEVNQVIGEQYGEAKDVAINPSGTLVTGIDEGSVTLLSAPKGTGNGIYSVGFEEDVIGVVIDPSTAKEGNYESVITWTLESVPYGEIRG